MIDRKDTEMLTVIELEDLAEGDRSWVLHPRQVSPAIVVRGVNTRDDNVLSALVGGLGELDRRGNETPDQWVYDLYADNTTPGRKPLSRRSDEFGLHTDCAILDPPPDWVVLACVRPASQGGSSLILTLEQVVNQLDDSLLDVLAEARFDFVGRDVPLPVLQRTDQGWTVRYRRGYVRGMTGDHNAAQAVKALDEALDAAGSTEVLLAAGDVLVIDNRRVLHGRSSFGNDGSRHLRRVRLRA